MSPSFNHRDFVFASRWPWTRFREGQVVLVNHPRYQYIIKRIHRVRKNAVLLMGDNSCSTSTDELGWVNDDRIVGRIYWRIPVG